MAISEKDIKKLWGLAAGRCSKPGCDAECVKFLGSDLTVIGEMAHIIAQSPKGPRGMNSGGTDTYENLILLCPTDHSAIDKAPPGTFSTDLLLGWKKAHEDEVASAFRSPSFASMNELRLYLCPILIENKILWRTYGPESHEAAANPFSNLAKIWALRKLSTIVPNNRKIIEAIHRNRDLFRVSEYEIACLFIEHAEGFERNCYDRTEGIPRFPVEFEELVRSEKAIQ